MCFLSLVVARIVINVTFCRISVKVCVFLSSLGADCHKYHISHILVQARLHNMSSAGPLDAENIAFVQLFSTMRFQMSPQTACPRGCITTLVAFILLSSTISIGYPLDIIQPPRIPISSVRHQILQPDPAHHLYCEGATEAATE